MKNYNTGFCHLSFMESFPIAPWNEQYLAELGERGMLAPGDLELLSGCMPAMVQAHYTTQVFRTRTEMEVSVLNDIIFPTPDAKYWQAVREMAVFVENLFMLSFTYRQKLLDLEELDAALKEAGPGSLEARRKALEVEKARYELLLMQREAHHRIREIGEWKEIQDGLRPSLACGDREVDDHQLVSYGVRFIKELYEAVRTRQPQGMESMRNVLAHVQTILRVAREWGLEDRILEEIKETPDLLNFLRKNNLVRKMK